MSVWSLVLAAGQGRRLASITGGVPKQFWAPDGRQTLLEQTLARLAPLAPLTRTVTVIDRSHRALTDTRGRGATRPFGLLLEQPSDRGTGAGVAFGVAAVAARDPGAIVVLTPSDHGVRDDDEYRHGLASAIHAIRRGRERAVLFGVEAAGPDGEYGWITAAARPVPFRRVLAFVEKPNAAMAAALFTRGAVWNTMVMVATVETLVRLYRRHLPWVLDVCGRAAAHGSHRPSLVVDEYAALPRSDFSGDLVTHAEGLALYTWPASVGWSDLGTPDRLSQWLADAPGRPPRTATEAPTCSPAA